jgi:hypothetical protein
MGSTTQVILVDGSARFSALTTGKPWITSPSPVNKTRQTWFLSGSTTDGVKTLLGVRGGVGGLLLIELPVPSDGDSVRLRTQAFQLLQCLPEQLVVPDDADLIPHQLPEVVHHAGALATSIVARQRCSWSAASASPPAHIATTATSSGSGTPGVLEQSPRGPRRGACGRSRARDPRPRPPSCDPGRPAPTPCARLNAESRAEPAGILSPLWWPT